ncbi:unnamed protein product [Kuraishia capsulata CBS 1993]|uniref:UDP-N-acetylglucosamine transferase subunit ALG14 n=1 Tax=Kuraishia capsulata CBS 1993 TaxID=1382522 RepID=W6MLJ4_9ASCO|nr:uncharacterized protein KUCA_T00003357001 [Kuraishia capsulata CBS 1993]CDK27379.1 unnamed protein product [Kuraishia capsulata CBS 1993]
MDCDTEITVIASVTLLIGLVVVLRLIYCLPCVYYSSTKRTIDEAMRIPKGTKIMILLGSGGHTGEMIRILGQFSNDSLENLEKTYVVSSGDETSLLRIKQLEETLRSGKDTRYIILPRARSVGESSFSALFNTLKSFLYTVRTFVGDFSLIPDVLLLNGPGTAVPLAYLVFFFKLIGLGHTRIVYVESLARVNNLSISGKCILPLADRFIVQWEKLAHDYNRCEYYGVLV